MGSVKALAGADWGSIAIVSLTAAAGIVALAGGFQGWLIERTSRLERVMLLAAGLLLVYPKAWADVSGLVLMAVVITLQWRRRT